MLLVGHPLSVKPNCEGGWMFSDAVEMVYVRTLLAGIEAMIYSEYAEA
jgi:hypothetical protein